MSDPQNPAATPDMGDATLAVPVTGTVPPAPPVAPSPVVPAEAVAAPVMKKRRAMGVTALVFALLALVIDVVTVVFGTSSMTMFGANSMTMFGDGNWGQGLGLVVGFVGYGMVAVIVGAIFAGTALVLGIGAMIGGSGRAAGVIASLLALGELVLHGIAIGAMIGLVTTLVSVVGDLESVPLDQLIPGLGQVSTSPTP